MQNLIDSIHENVYELVNSEFFKNWQRDQSIKEDDYVIVNNSTLLRNLNKTTKSQKYLSLHIQKTNPLSFVENIVNYPERMRKNNDFDVVSGKNKEFRTFQIDPLSIALEEEMDHLGKLIFLLIGCLDQSQVFDAPINHSRFKKLIYNHNFTTDFELSNDEIHIREISDADYILDILKNDHTEDSFQDQEFLKGLKGPLDSAVKILKAEAYTLLILPDTDQDLSNCFLDRFIQFFETDLQNYQSALAELNDNTLDNSSLNEILRISYTFREEMNRMLRLIFSLCDLKPIIFWTTLKAQFELSAAFDALPFYKSKVNEKMSLQEYKTMIHGARNRAFHGVLDFNQDIEAALEGVTIKAHKLRIFSEYKSKKNLFDYEDKEIVDVLTEFTRPSEKHVSIDFWRKNYEVLESFTNLVISVSDSLKSLFAATKVNQPL